VTPRGRGAAVTVQCWGESPGASPIPGVFAVLVNGAYAGGPGRQDGSWVAVPATAALGATRSRAIVIEMAPNLGKVQLDHWRERIHLPRRQHSAPRSAHGQCRQRSRW
jgi:hypothetical protein